MECIASNAAYLAAKSQQYAKLDESSIIAVLPRIYFTVENVDDFLLSHLQDESNLAIAVEMLQLLDEFASLDLQRLWRESSLDSESRYFELIMLYGRQNVHSTINQAMYTYSDFEAQTSVEVKVKLIMRQLQHLLHEVGSFSCALS